MPKPSTLWAILGLLCGNSGGNSGPIRSLGRFWEDSGPIRLLGNSGPILGGFWEDFGQFGFWAILGRFWENSGRILGGFWAIRSFVAWNDRIGITIRS